MMSGVMGRQVSWWWWWWWWWWWYLTSHDTVRISTWYQKTLMIKSLNFNARLYAGFRTTARTSRAGRTRSDIICRWTSASSRCRVTTRSLARAATGCSIQTATTCSTTAAICAGADASRRETHSENEKNVTGCIGWAASTRTRVTSHDKYIRRHRSIKVCTAEWLASDDHWLFTTSCYLLVSICKRSHRLLYRIGAYMLRYWGCCLTFCLINALCFF